MRRSLSAVLAALVYAHSAPAREITVTARPVIADSRCTIEAFALHNGSEDGARVAIEPPLIVTSPVVTTLTVSDEARQLSAVTEDCWANRVALSDSTDAVTVDMWPAGVVRGKYAMARGTRQPRVIAGTFVDATAERNDGAVAEHSLQCTMQSEVWQCSVPAQRPLHLKLTIDDFAPIYLWDLIVRDTTDTSDQTLAPGGSVVGRVSGPMDQPIENARVVLVAATSAQQPAADRQLTSLRARSDAKGYFQFVGVPPGSYRLTSAAAGLADAIRERIEIRAGQDLRLDDDLVHRPMAELEVIVTPPVSATQQPWTLRLRRAGEGLSEVVRVAEEPVRPDGVWTRANLQPASYTLTVHDAAGSEVARRTVELQGGPERVLIEVVAIEVHGKVVPADLARGVSIDFRRSGRSVRTTTDEDGAFSAAFPLPGLWQASLTLGANEGEVRLEEVEIRSPHDEELLLELPAGRLEGRVFGPNGLPAAAVVRIDRGDRLVAERRTDEGGRFELTALTPGSYIAEAETTDAFAGPVTVEIDENEATEIELRATAFREITGSVITADGTAASGAVVRVFDPMTRTYEDLIADGKGSYSFRVKPGAAFIDLIVIAPPHPIALRRIPVGGKRTQSIGAVQLAPTGAKLRVFLQQTPPWPMLRAPDGNAYPLGLLVAPRFGYGRPAEWVNGVYEFRVEPGSYTLCNDGGECHSAILAVHAESLVTFAPKKIEEVP